MISSERKRESEHEQLHRALTAFDEGSRLLEEAYRELWQAREGERSERDLGEAERIRDFCHEIKNPLGGTRALLTLLERELTETGTEKARRLLASALGGLDDVEAVVGRTVPSRDALADAGAIVEEVCALVLADCHARDEHVHFSIEAASGIDLPLEASLFRRLLFNLVRNAAESGSAKVVVRLTSSLESLCLEIDDAGRGLPEVADHVLFSRGFSEKGSGRGRGLGLVEDITKETNATILFCRKSRGTRVRVVWKRGVL